MTREEMIAAIQAAKKVYVWVVATSNQSDGVYWKIAKKDALDGINETRKGPFVGRMDRDNLYIG